VGMGLGFSHFEDGSLLEHFTQSNLGSHAQNVLGRMGLLHNVVGRQNAREISHNASSWIGGSRRPFFIAINYFDVHEPFIPEPGYMQRFSARQPPPDQFMWPNSIVLTPQQVSDEIDSYDACIAYTDRQISEFLDGLEQGGYLKNAIVIVTSDHGTSFNEQGFMFHGESLYWEQIHVPLMVYAPGRVPKGVRIATPVAFQSIPATLMDMLAVGNDATIPGPSLRALWEAPAAAENWPYPVSELAPQGDSPRFPSYYGPLKSVVTPEWHYIAGGKLGEELYMCCGGEPAGQESSQMGRGSAIGKALQNFLARGRLDKRFFEHSGLQKGPGPGSRSPEIDARLTKDTAANRERMNRQLRALGYVH